MSTQYVNRAELPKDYLSGDLLELVQNAQVLAKETVTSGAASAVADTLGAIENVQEIVAILPLATAVWARFAVAPVAIVGTDHYCPAGLVSRFLVPQGFKLATIDA
ncbi:hypothetical protein [Mesorhizobium sp. M0767]|uniref:hypothetical protein n=1 Tax=Mesorhizobium sp. M0767 TaxID=2956995 RepID=UPI00333830DA